MTRIERLTSSRDFDGVFRRGTRAQNGLVTCIAGPARDGGAARLGVRAPRAAGGAVVRNRAKRRLREAARAVHLRRGWDVLLVARPGLPAAPFGQVADAVHEAVRAAGAAC